MSLNQKKAYRYQCGEHYPMEHLIFRMPKENLESCLQSDYDVWTLGEGLHEEFAEIPFPYKEVWVNDNYPGEAHYIFAWEDQPAWDHMLRKDIQDGLEARFEECQPGVPYIMHRAIFEEENFGIQRVSRFERLHGPEHEAGENFCDEKDASKRYRYQDGERYPIEYHVYQVAEEDLQDYLDATHEVWTLGEALDEGFENIPFLYKEVWVNENKPGEVHTIICWESRESWVRCEERAKENGLLQRFQKRFTKPCTFVRAWHEDENFGLYRVNHFKRL